MAHPLPAAPVMTGAPPPPEGLATLANWRTAPFSRWAFHHVREIVPTAAIAAGEPLALPTAPRDLAELSLPGGPRGEAPLCDVLCGGEAQALVVLQGGRLLWEWYGRGYDGTTPYILFSVSKSVTGLLAGIAMDRGLIDPGQRIGALLPEVEGSAYGDCALTHVLDMTVSTAFEEAYLDPDGDYARYRVATNWNPLPPAGPPADLRGFLATLRPAPEPHGEVFRYVSPNSDLLGWVLERASGRRIADLVSDWLWRPMGAEAPADITVDRLGAGRTAGGICARPRDLARLGEMVRRRGMAGGRAVVPGWWIDDMRRGGDRQAWLRGDMVSLFPAGRYRSQWYQSGLASGAFCAIGIHGQWLWIDPAAELVVARLAAQPEPLDDDMDQQLIAGFDALGRALGRALG